MVRYTIVFNRLKALNWCGNIWLTISLISNTYRHIICYIYLSKIRDLPRCDKPQTITESPTSRADKNRKISIVSCSIIDCINHVLNAITQWLIGYWLLIIDYHGKILMAWYRGPIIIFIVFFIVFYFFENIVLPRLRNKR